MQASQPEYDSELSRSLASKIEYSYDPIPPTDNAFLTSYINTIAEIEQLYHDGRVLQAQRAWQAAKDYFDSCKGEMSKSDAKKIRSLIKEKEPLWKAIDVECDLTRQLLDKFSTERTWDRVHKTDGFSVSFAQNKETNMISVMLIASFLAVHSKFPLW